MTEQDHTMFASFALMGILARIDGPVSGANKAHWAAEAWSWADAMVDAMVDAGARRAQAHEGTDDTPPRDPAAAPAAAESSGTATSER